MSDRSYDDDTRQRVRRASAGEPQAGRRAVESQETPEPRDLSTSGADTPEDVRDEDRQAATDRIERMQREGKGMGGTPTQGRSDVGDEEEIERAARDETD